MQNYLDMLPLDISKLIYDRLVLHQLFYAFRHYVNFKKVMIRIDKSDETDADELSLS